MPPMTGDQGMPRSCTSTVSSLYLESHKWLALAHGLLVRDCKGGHPGVHTPCKSMVLHSRLGWQTRSKCTGAQSPLVCTMESRGSV